MLNLLEVVFVGVFLAGLWMVSPPVALMAGGVAGVLVCERAAARARPVRPGAEEPGAGRLRRVA